MQIALLSLQYMGRFMQSQTLNIVKKSAKMKILYCKASLSTSIIP